MCPFARPSAELDEPNQATPKNSGIMNHLLVCGLNYHSAPIAIRERFTIPDSCVKHALHALNQFPHLVESAILSTCNRTEVYAVVTDVQAGLKEIEAFFASVQGISDHGALRPNFKLLREDVALHIMRVASGLDSMVLGEGQIMAQVKESHRKALEAGTAGPVLDQLFQLALSCGKRVRSETTLGKRAVSVSSAAVELARETLSQTMLSREEVLVVGAGRMAQICVKHLTADKGKGKVQVINRSQEKLHGLMQNEFKGKERIAAERSFDDRHAFAARSPLVIVATSAPSYLLSYESFLSERTKWLAESNGKDLKNCLIIDISVPRNVDPRIGDIEGVTLKHADDLASVVTKNMKEREALVDEAEIIVFQTLDEFHTWQRSRLVVPTIAGLREKIEAIRMEQISKGSTMERESGGCPQTAQKHEAEAVSRAIVNQILHHPTVQLKATRDYKVLKQQAEALRTLFNLDPLDESHTTDKPGRKAGRRGVLAGEHGHSPYTSN